MSKITQSINLTKEKIVCSVCRESHDGWHICISKLHKLEKHLLGLAGNSVFGSSDADKALFPNLRFELAAEDNFGEGLIPALTYTGKRGKSYIVLPMINLNKFVETYPDITVLTKVLVKEIKKGLEIEKLRIRDVKL